MSFKITSESKIMFEAKNSPQKMLRVRVALQLERGRGVTEGGGMVMRFFCFDVIFVARLFLQFALFLATTEVFDGKPSLVQKLDSGIVSLIISILRLKVEFYPLP